MKNLKYVLIMFVSLTMAVACNDDDGEMDKNSLIGSWEMSESDSGFEYSLTVTFKSNSSGTMAAFASFQGEEEMSSDSFTWSTDGNILTIVMDGETSKTTYSISGDQLTISDDEETLVLIRQ